ncbi:transport and Golgi organization protein 1 isoform X2 [Topomyia yanbarensis]|uniref:transport and Golgi organization protein 1 isoform X2 n=1 Tax=Topomyia yanbarensis TaxID=2498891 RepID=UPI00273AC62F|nr:transport and Golgi organization protein 1 isoform X2 [Topomyia yanbarensis]
MKKLNFTGFVHIYCLVLVLTLTRSSAKECGDPDCKTSIATAYATLNYFGGGDQKVTLSTNDKVEILGRNIGKDKDYLIRKADGKEGLASRKFLKELKILVKKDDLVLIPENEPTKINPSPAVEPNVIAGTTLLSNPEITEKHITNEQPQASEKSPDLEIVPSANVSPPTNSLPSEPNEVPKVESSDAKSNETEEEDDEDNEVDEEAGVDDDDDEEEEAEEDESEEVTGGSSEQIEEQTVEQTATTQSSESKNETATDDLKASLPEKTEQQAAEKMQSSELKNATDSVDSESGLPEQMKKQTVENAEQIVQGLESKSETISIDSESSLSEEKKDAPEIQLTEEKQSTIQLTEERSVEVPLVVMAASEPTVFTTHTPIDETTKEAEQNSNHINDTVLETSTVNDSITATMEEIPTREQSESIEFSTKTVSEAVTTTIVPDDPRQEIPVTEEPESSTEIPVTTNTNQATQEQLPRHEPDLPKQPHQLLRGGLGNLLAHSHHHHHHGNGHHHHHHGHDHHRHEETSQEQIDVQGQTDDGAFLGSLVDGHTRSGIENKVIDSHEQQEAAPENGYCDQQSCPQPNPAQPPSVQQHANGFHHPMVGNKNPSSDSMASQHESPPAEDSVVSSSTIPDEPEQDHIDYAQMFILELFKLSDLILLLAITSFTLIVFSLGHYLINKNRKEKPLIYKLNMIERDLMASHKENAMLKSDLMETRHKLTSIENNSFGSNDMVIALRQELEDAEQTKLELQEQIASLEKELENAAEAGLELNKMVAELLNQSGSDSIALTVDELQRQLNEQQQTILSMNTTLADKSRENSELQIVLSNQSTKFAQELEDLQQSFNDLKLEKHNLEIELNNLKSGQSSQVETLRKESSSEISKLNKEVKLFQSKWEDSKKSLNAAEAKLAAMQECLNDVKRGTNLDGLIKHVDLKAEVTVLQKENYNLQDRLQGEIVARQLLDDHVKIVNEEISTLKKDYSQAEKEKLESETRLEVLSTYFKDKETQLQKELSIKEAMWMQQQGETTSTVERIRTMQDEIQQLKSQNDKLRVEIEAQTTAHKAQYTALETRSHDAWLAARQAERRLEEARNESSALRRKLTALGDVSATNPMTDGMLPNPVPPPDLNHAASSPLRVESPNAPMMGLPPPPFIPPPFGQPFLPPFMPPPLPGEMRPAPLGRLMSPPPNRYSPNMIDTRDRFSPDRGRYSPDSRYDYSVMSNYETETDFSPPPSPPPHSRRSNYDRERDHRSDRDRDRDRDRDHDLRDRERDIRERDGRTSGSGGTGGKYPKAFSPPGMRTTSPPIQDPRNKKYQGGFSSGSQDSTATRKSGKQYTNANRKPSP